MSPKAPPVFEALPVEVVANILQQTASPEDLYCTIQASPNAFRSFLCFRETILIKVLRAHLSAEIFAELLGLLHVPKYEDLNYVPNRSEFEYYRKEHFGPRRDFLAWENCRYKGWHTVFNAFLETHLGNVQAAKSSEFQRYSVPRPVDKQQINYIISTYGMLQRFIRDYQSFVRSISTGSPPPLSDLDPSFRRQERAASLDWGVNEPRVWPPLSENEAIRLQRGFLRYELCSRSNAIPTWNMELMQWDADFAMELEYSVPKYLERWEEEEIRCIWTYVHRQYQVLVRDIVAEFRCDVRNLSRKARHASDNEVVLAPNISDSGFGRWTYNMSCLGLPMLQQVLRSGFDDQRRFVKNTTFDRLPLLDGALSLSEENDLGDDWDDRVVFADRRESNGPPPNYVPVIVDLVCWPRDSHIEYQMLMAIETELKDIGWVFWEDVKRLDYLGWPTRDIDSDADNDISSYLQYLAHLNQPNRFQAEDKYPEQSLYVTKEDYQGELSAKYAVGPLSPAGSYLFLDKLREISDWSSKKMSPAFQEICQGFPTSG